MAIDQNGLQHRDPFELGYVSRAILAMSIPMQSHGSAVHLRCDVVQREIDLRLPSLSP
jgi:hypothetical protein